MKKGSSRPPKFKITKVKCCYTCIKSMHGEGVSCSIHYGYADWTSDKRLHYGVSVIGICKNYKQLGDIRLSTEVSHQDNITFPDVKAGGHDG